MGFPTKSGGKKSSKFRASRHDREHAETPEPKESAEPKDAAPKMNEPIPQESQKPMGQMGEPMQQAEGMEPDHAEIKQVATEHGPAHTVNMVHDHESQTSHVHSIHQDGHEHHADHKGSEHSKHAHHHAAHAAGVPLPGEEEKEGEYPQEHEPAGEDDDEQYGEPL